MTKLSVAQWHLISSTMRRCLTYLPMSSVQLQPACTHKVRLTKQRNVDLTTDGLWAMPAMPVKAQRLQDWEKLKYGPMHKQGDVCPNGSQPL